MAAETAGSRITLVLPTLLGGGAERVATDLANHWASSGRYVTIITVDALHEPRYAIDDRVVRRGLGLSKESQSLSEAVWNNGRRVRMLRQALRSEANSVVVSFTDITNITTLIAATGLPLKVIVSERTDPRHQRIGRAWSTLRNLWYRRAAAVVVQTDGVAAWARTQHWGNSIHVIPNPAPSLLNEPALPSQSIQRSNTVVGLGRLSHEKGFDLLMEAFARVGVRHPDWRLMIWGEGSERASLERLIDRLRLSGRVDFPGWTNQPREVLRQASIFVLSSRYEGFPNALLEAMCAGLACIAFDCESGPREIIREGLDGRLVPTQDVEGLAATLEELISDRDLRERLGAQAHHVAERFEREAVFARWDALIDRAGS